MPKIYRLNDKKTIENCAIRGYKTQSKFFIVKSLKSDSEKRFAIVISKKTEKFATKRNKVRRQVKYCLQKHITDIPNGQYLIMLKLNSFKPVYKEMEKDLLQNF